jgi:hypothetical protein
VDAPRATRLSFDQLADVISSTIEPVTQGKQIDLLAICSTTVSPRFWHGAVEAKRSERGLIGGGRASAVVWCNAYQCASWIQVLRSLAPLAGLRRIGIAILDIEMDGLGWIEGRHVWAEWKEGLLHVILDRVDEHTHKSCFGACPEPGRELLSFGKMAGRFHAGCDSRFFGPFFPGSFDSVLHSTMRELNVAPSLYSRYLHCFGADPWIGLAHAIKTARSALGDSVVLGALALRGYYGFHEIGLGSNCVIENFSDAKGCFVGVDS